MMGPTHIPVKQSSSVGHMSPPPRTVRMQKAKLQMILVKFSLKVGECHVHTGTLERSPLLKRSC